MEKLLKQEENIILKSDNTIWSYYFIENQDCLVIDDLKKKDFKINNSSFFLELSKYKYLELKMLPISYDIENMLIELSSSCNEKTLNCGQDLLQKTFDYINEDIYVYKWVLGVCIKSNENFSNGFSDVFSNLKQNYLKTKDYDLEKYKKEEKEIFDKISILNARRLNSLEINLYLRNCFSRGVVSSEKDIEIDDSVINFSDYGYVKTMTYSDSENNIGYSSFLPLISTIEDLENCNLCEEIQKLNFKIELHFFIRYEENKGTFGLHKKATMNKKRLAETVNDNLNATGDYSTSIYESKLAIDDLVDDIEKDKHFLSFSLVACISGETKEEVKSKVEVFKSNFNGFFNFSRCGFDQSLLFFSCCYGIKASALKNWLHLVEINTFVECLPFINKGLGTISGFYIGKIDNSLERATSLNESIEMSNNYVFFNPLIINKGLANSLTDSPHIAITGETGRGKSFLMKYLHMYLSLQAKTLYIDPKKEYRKRFNTFFSDEKNKDTPLYNHLLNNFSFITIDHTDKNNYGVLDPIVFLPKEESKDLCFNIINSIYNIKDDKIELEIVKAINQICEKRLEGKIVGFKNVIDVLVKNDDEQISNCGKLLYEKINNSILELIFSYGDEKTLEFNSLNTILEIINLDLPKEDNKTFLTPSNIYSLCVMFCIGKYCEKFGSRNVEEETCIFVDECWLFQITEVGKSIFNSMRRVGRSQNNMLIYGTQSVLDFDIEKEGSNFGCLFAFDEKSQRDKILNFLGLEVNEKTLKYLANTLKGQCLFCDNKKRVGKLSVDCIFDEFLELFKTVEKTRSAKLEESYL